MKNLLVFPIVLIVLFSCSSRDDQASADDGLMEEINCVNLQNSLTALDSEKVNMEINKLTADLFPDPTPEDEVGHSANLERLIQRIDENCGELDVALICYACIETLPPQSEIKITYTVEEEIIEKIVDIASPKNGSLESVGIHQED